MLWRQVFIPGSLIYMLQHQLSCFSKFLLFIKGPSSEFLHYSPTYNQRQGPNLLSILGMSTAVVEFGSQKNVHKQCWEMTFLCTCGFKKDLIFIAGFSSNENLQLLCTCHCATILPKSTQYKAVPTVLCSVYTFHLYTTLAHVNANYLVWWVEILISLMFQSLLPH